MTDPFDPFRPPQHVVDYNYTQWFTNLLEGDNVSLRKEDIIKAAIEREPTQKPPGELPPGFDILLENYLRESDLSPVGRESVFFELVRCIASRMVIDTTLTNHPEIKDQEIKRPLIIVGFPRTGTTLLHNLMCCYPGVRIPYFWEITGHTSLPPEQNQERIKNVDMAMEGFYGIVPKMRAIHNMKAMWPEECVHLFQNSFFNPYFTLYAPLTSFFEYIMQADATPHYQYYRLQLQYLQWKSPGAPWVLKSPMHMFYLDTLLEIFPDANVVMTHRKPEEFLASMCSMYAVMQRVLTQSMKCDKIGAVQSHMMETALDRAMAARHKIPASQILDINFRELVSNPLEMVKSIYSHFGYPEKEEHEQAMKAWLAENQMHKHGAHKYSLEQFGLNSDDVRARFKGYTDQYLEN